MNIELSLLVDEFELQGESQDYDCVLLSNRDANIVVIGEKCVRTRTIQ